MIKNVFPELPVIPYEKTSIPEQTVIDYIRSLSHDKEVKRTVWIMFANESGHGAKGVNNNYAGIQADGGRLGNGFDVRVTATCITPENMTGKPRRFAVFSSWKDSIDYLASRVMGRGLYIGGQAHPYAKNMPVRSPEDLARAYWKEWVQGDNSEPPENQKKNIMSMYTKAAGMFL